MAGCALRDGSACVYVSGAAGMPQGEEKGRFIRDFRRLRKVGYGVVDGSGLIFPGL